MFQVLLPDREVITVSLRKSSNADEVYSAVCKKIDMSKETSQYFYLFEIVEYNFGKFIALSCVNLFRLYTVVLLIERKLQPSEYPHNLYIQNYSTATSTCLCIRKWLFSLSRELTLLKDPQATSYIFWQVYILSFFILSKCLQCLVSNFQLLMLYLMFI